MTTPIIDFVKNYIASNNLRLHMPGHKGEGILGFEKYDITEIDGADVLYNAKGIIKQSMENATMIFGSGKTLYSAEGSSLSIRAMLYLVCLYANLKGEKPLIFAGRNAHKVFIMSAAVLDFDIKWLYGEGNGGITECLISPKELERELSASSKKPVAVYITSPDYLGNIADVEGISQVCKKYGVLLVCDNAHGAYLNFLPENRHPIHLGADICCDSAHKTLPALTGAGYLHISKNAPPIIQKNAEKAMSLFASTSPSYLILQSLDYMNKYLSDGYRDKLSDFCDSVCNLKKRLSDIGIANLDTEPLKITFTPKEFGYTGLQLNDNLRNCGLVCEFYDPDRLVIMLTPENGENALSEIYRVMSALKKRERIPDVPPQIPTLTAVLSIKQVLISETETLPIEQCVGRIFAGINASCPPAVPIAVCGELIDHDVIKLLRYYGEEWCEVLKKPN